MILRPKSAEAPSRRATLLGLGATLAAASASLGAPAAAAPRARLIDRHWRGAAAEPGPNHIAWTAFLGRYRRLGADGVARFAYGAVTPEDRAALAAYIATLEASRPTAMTRPAAFAVWANLYNALTVALVLDAYPVASIKYVRGGLFGTGPWDEKVATVEGRRLSLDDIEHGILRPVWADPRIHYAVNCAAIGCPNLGAAAWEAATLDADLDAAARAYVNDPRGARIERGRLTVSSIYAWFEEDFGGTEAGVLDHLRAYAVPSLAAALEGRSGYDRDAYDWSLNDV